MSSKAKAKVLDILLICWILFLLTITLVRNCYGIEITDEAFHISESISVMRGNIPYTYAMSCTPGFTFIMLPLVKLYSFLVPDLEGIFLFTRIAFMLFRMGILLLSYFLLRKYYKKKYLIFILSLLIPVWGSDIPNFSYNTISIWLLFLVSVIQLSTIKSGNQKIILWGAVLSGAIVAVAEFAHIAQVLNVFWFGLTYLLCTRKKYQPLAVYILTGLFVLFAVLGIIAAREGLDKLVFGIETIITYTNFSTVKLSIYEQLKNIVIVFQKSIHIFSFTIAVCWALRWGIQIVPINYGKFKLECIKKAAVNIRTVDIILLAMLLAIRNIFKYGSLSYIKLQLGAIGGILVILCWMKALIKRDRNTGEVTALMMMYPLSQFMVTVFFTGTPAYLRTYPLIFSVFGFGILLEEYVCEGSIIRKLLAISSLSGFFCLLLYGDYYYVYRDGSIDTLDTRVEQGIYKHVYTSSENARNIVELENYIKENASSNNRVLYLDLAPMAYLMSEGIPWAPSTWDTMQYSYGFNHPEIMYRYFKNKGSIPDIVIYIDFGRDEQISVDDENYLFNDFINKYYVLDDSQTLNDQFRVKKYVRNEEEVSYKVISDE